MFDLRSLEHSSIVYEDTAPLLRFAWNRIDPNYLAVRGMCVCVCFSCAANRNRPIH